MPSGGLADLVLAAAAARRYYLEGQSKVEIASDLRVSRFKVARLLDLARTSGLVRISIGNPGAVDAELSDQVRQRLGLKRAIVVNTVDGDDAETRGQLAVYTASLLEDVLTPHDVLGIGWSRAALETAARLQRLPACKVVQLSGALAHPGVTANLVEAVDRLARLGGGHSYTYYAPMFVSDAASADVIKRQPDTAAAFSQFPRVTRAVVGIGCWQPPESNLRDALTPKERNALHRSDIVADLCGAFLEASGEPLSMPLSRRVVGISAEQLRAVPDVICIAHGKHKAPAVCVAVRAGYVETLVTTAAFAQELLACREPGANVTKHTGLLDQAPTEG